MMKAGKTVLRAASALAVAATLAFGAREALAAPAPEAAAAATCYPEPCDWNCTRKGYDYGYCDGGIYGRCVCGRF